MAGSIAVLLYGDPGPVRRELLLRAEIDAHWATTHDEVMTLLSNVRFALMVIAPDVERSQEIINVVRESKVPCIRLLEPTRTGEYPAPKLAQLKEMLMRESARATLSEIDRDLYAPIDDVGRVLIHIEQLTSLRFARNPRVALRFPTRARVHGTEYNCATVNLSVSGVLLENFPATPLGTPVDLVIDAPDGPIDLHAQIIRASANEGMTQTGLAFLNVGAGQRVALERIVRRALRTSSKVRLEEQILEALSHPISHEPQSTADLIAGATDVWRKAQEVEMALLGDLVNDREPQGYVPPRLRKINAELTEPERKVLAGKSAPPWASMAVQLRVALAGIRTNPTYRREAPPDLIDRTYELISHLSSVSEGQGANVVVHITRIRAALLREIFSSETGMRNVVVGLDVSQSQS
jgi:hypothetical protein